MKRSPATDSTQETVDGRRAFESWLFDKLPYIISTELQVGKYNPEFHLVKKQ